MLGVVPVLYKFVVNDNAPCSLIYVFNTDDVLLNVIAINVQLVLLPLFICPE